MVSPDTGTLVANKFYEWINNSDIMFDGKKVGVTISVGIGVVKHGDNLESLIRRVCNLVKEAKKEKNKIVSDFEWQNMCRPILVYTYINLFLFRYYNNESTQTSYDVLV